MDKPERPKRLLMDNYKPRDGCLFDCREVKDPGQTMMMAVFALLFCKRCLFCISVPLVGHSCIHGALP